MTGVFNNLFYTDTLAHVKALYTGERSDEQKAL